MWCTVLLSCASPLLSPRATTMKHVHSYILELNAGRLATVTHTRSQQREVVVILNLNTRTDNTEDTWINQERIRMAARVRACNSNRTP